MSTHTPQPLREAGHGILPRPVSFAAVELVFLGVFFATSAFSPFLSFYETEWHFGIWLVTFAFGIYALALLVALLTVGALSDYLGRRPVLVISLLLCALSMVMVMLAPSIGWVIAGRIIQGFATGAATGAISAGIVELAPRRHHSVGVLLASITPPAGQAVGGLITGSVLSLSRNPSLIIFGTLAAVFVVGAALVGLGGETVSRRPGAARSLIPRVSVPAASRVAFTASVPVLISTWMTGAFYLGLLPTAAGPVFHTGGGFITGLTLTLLNGVGVLTTLATQRLAPATRAIFGEAVLVVGIVALAASLSLGSVALLITATCVAGVGYGWAFSGVLGTVLATGSTRDRAALFSAIYVVSYLALGVPAIIAGIAADSLGVLATAIGYSLIVAIAAAGGLLTQLRLNGASRR
ncbi:MFS transporter [Gryllotalpicola reticulitermitis]|uniref:MFS transporter n=1 Tax=Gryllotalpicola reticulitermitis TaxID=1184153 RepID=A0ABV8Q9K3_9MICO